MTRTYMDPSEWYREEYEVRHREYIRSREMGKDEEYIKKRPASEPRNYQLGMTHYSNIEDILPII